MRALGIDIGGSSVKVCLIDDDQRLTARSEGYQRPDREQLALAIRDVVSGLDLNTQGLSVGLCLPGKRHPSGESIERSVNLPCLNGWRFDELLAEALGAAPERYRVVTDAYASAYDWYCAHTPGGRIAAIAIGTGVGLCVLDEGKPIGIGERGIGHLGLVDVGRLGERDTVSFDGATNTLESYVGALAVGARFGETDADAVSALLCGLPMDDPFLRALIFALRLTHAIYAPDTIVLMGGIGIALAPRGDQLRETVSRGLTSLAVPDWRLRFGDSLYHAASGAALLAGESA